MKIRSIFLLCFLTLIISSVIASAMKTESRGFSATDLNIMATLQDTTKSSPSSSLSGSSSPSMGCNQCNVENLNFLTNSFPKRTIEVYTDQPPNEVKYGENVHVNFIPIKKKEEIFFNSATPFYFLKYKELIFNKFVKSYDDQSLTNLYFDNLRILLN